MSESALEVPKVNILAFKYVRCIRIFIWILGCWPGEVFNEKMPIWFNFYKKFNPTQYSIIFLCQMNYVQKYASDIDFFQGGYCVLHIFLCINAVFRLTLPNFPTYGRLLKFWLMNFHLGHIKHKSEYHLKVFNTVQKVSYYFTLYIMVTTYFGLFVFSFSPLYLNYKNGFFTGEQAPNSSYDCIVCFVFPGIVDTRQFSLLSTIYSIYLTYPCAVSVCGLDLLILLMVFQIIGQILVLRNDLETLPRPEEKEGAVEQYYNSGQKVIKIPPFQMFDKRMNEVIHQKLVDSIIHHKMIITFADDVSTFFGPLLAFNYGMYLVSCCLLLIESSQGGTDGLLRFGPLTISVFGQLIMLSVIFEIVSTVSEKLKDSVYYTPWEHMDPRNRRTVHIMFVRMQTPITVTAMGMIEVGVQTMAKILKATMSYYTLLRSMNE